MTPDEAPLGTVATLGHPANKILIVKGAHDWRYVHNGLFVKPEDFRAGWEVYVPEARRQLTVRFDITDLTFEQEGDFIAALSAQAEADERTGRPAVQLVAIDTGARR